MNVRDIQGAPRRTARQLLAGAVVCKQAIPGMKQEHDWRIEQGSEGLVHICKRCDRRIGF